jgi:NAD+ kinase
MGIWRSIRQVEMTKRIGIVSRLDHSDALAKSKEIYDFILSRKLTVLPETGLARLQNLDGGCPISEMNADLIITVGGDGTVLKTCINIPHPDTPILSVNMGRRGYLTEVEPVNAIKAIESCLAGKYKLEDHSKLSVYLNDRRLADSLNEALVTSALPSKMLRFSLGLNSRKLVECRADSLIVATPTGSTAHAMSAGGPILDNSLDAFVMVFVCSLEPIRPMVIPSRSTVEISLLDERPMGEVVIDGRYQHRLYPRTPLKLRKSEHKAVFVRFETADLSRSLLRLQPRELRSM